MAAKGNGNGNGGDLSDLGHALSGMTKLPSSTAAATPEPKTVAAENGAQSGIVRPVEHTLPRVVPSAAQAPAPAQMPGQAPAQPAAQPSVPPRSAGPVPVAAGEDVADIAAARQSAAAVPVAEAAAPSGDRPSGGPKPAAANGGTPKRDGSGGAGSDGGEAEQEAARDARLLRFVYVMAALTGIVAIVLYAGGWLREGPKQRAPEEVVASAPAQQPSPPADASGAAPALDVGKSPIPETSGATQAIPPAPPVVAPSVTESKPGAPDTPLTTGGPAKPQPEALPSMPSGTETGQGAATGGLGLPPAAVPTIPAPSGAQSGVAAKDAAEPGAPPAPITPGASASASPKTVAPDESAAGKGVRDVPNLRVLAPALVKPEPVESAPPPAASTVPEPSSVPVMTVPKPTQTAAVPKVAPVKPKASAASGDFLVQLASVTSEKLAEREWARLQKAFPDIFGSRTLTVEKKEIAGRGTFYRVQTGGYSTLDEARSVCNGLKEKKQACLPVNR
ncbi:MAG: SPOR domain-containing protein [Alphaproteobacteria bacterium]